jgi:hypothetical protein
LASVASLGRADDVASYLDRLGLFELLARHLEHRLVESPEAEHEEIVGQLADVYARLLEQPLDSGRQADLEARCRQLLAAAPLEQTDELRLALLRASYRAAETAAEKHRLRLIPVEEATALRETFGELTKQLGEVREQFDRKVDDATRRLNRSGGSESVLLAEQLERLERLRDQCTFLNAWSLYYWAWLGDHREGAKLAEPLFARLLRAETDSPLPGEISVDLRELEVVARSILGMALAKSISASAPTALEWLELLEAEGAYPPLQQELPAWRLAILVQHQQFGQVRELWNALHERDDPIPLPWIRIVAVAALEATDRKRDADELARLAMTELATRGELDQVLDLGNRYGLDALGEAGFAGQYVRAVQQYHHAREEHGDERPTTSAELISAYAAVVTRLRNAIGQPDAALYEGAATNARLLVAWCLYFQGKFLEARIAFEESLSNLPQDEAAEALWMAIVSLDRVVQADRKVAAAEDLNRLIDRFLSEFPSHEHAPALRLRRAASSEEPSREAVAELLEIPPNSEVYVTSRLQAASMLYRLFREAPAAQQAELGNQYLTVAVPLLASHTETLSPTGPMTVPLFVVHCRYILDAALRPDVQRIVAAHQALGWLDALKDNPEVNWPTLKPEIEFRRVQERMFSDDEAAAERIADELHAAHPDSAWSRQAQRVMFKAAYDRWRAAPESSVDVKLLDRVVHFGSRIIEEASESETPSARDRMSYMLAVAEAQMQRWRASGSMDRAADAKRLFESLLAQQPRDAGLLRAVAELSQALDQLDRAADCWRMLAAGADPMSELFYEAKFNLIQVLSKTDPSRAREVMAQHRQLYPDYGPDPWGPRLRALDDRLGEAPRPAETDDQEPAA